MSLPKKEFKGVWIPKRIWEATDISWKDKCLLAEIDFLDDGSGCFASNEHLGSVFGCGEDAMKKQISILRSKGYLKDVKSDGRMRYISCCFSSLGSRDGGKKGNLRGGKTVTSEGEELSPLRGKSGNHEISHKDNDCNEIDLVLAGGGTSLGTSLDKEYLESDFSLSSKPSASLPLPPTPSPKVTWLTPYCNVWMDIFGGVMPASRFAKPLRMVEKRFGASKSLAAWKRYCKEQGKYASGQEFESRIGLWIPEALKPAYVATTPEMMRRALESL